MFNKRINVFVVESAFDEGQVFRNFLLHLVPEQDFEQLDVFYDSVDFIAVEGEGLFKFFKDSNEIKDEAVGLNHLLCLVLIRTVHSRDGLEQCMVAHRLVEIHRVE